MPPISIKMCTVPSGLNGNQQLIGVQRDWRKFSDDSKCSFAIEAFCLASSSDRSDKNSSNLSGFVKGGRLRGIVVSSRLNSIPLFLHSQGISMELLSPLHKITGRPRDTGLP